MSSIGWQNQFDFLLPSKQDQNNKKYIFLWMHHIEIYKPFVSEQICVAVSVSPRVTLNKKFPPREPSVLELCLCFSKQGVFKLQGTPFAPIGMLRNACTAVTESLGILEDSLACCRLHLHEGLVRSTHWFLESVPVHKIHILSTSRSLQGTRETWVWQSQTGKNRLGLQDLG